MPQILVNFVSWVNLQSNSSLEDYRTTETTAWYYAMRPQTPESPELRLSRLVKMVIATPQLQRSAIEQSIPSLGANQQEQRTRVPEVDAASRANERRQTVQKLWGVFAGEERGKGDAKEGWWPWRSRELQGYSR